MLSRIGGEVPISYDEEGENRLPAPATTPEGREKQMIALAVDLAEKKLRDGTASPQIITHYLRLGTIQAGLEREKLKNENALLEAKTSALKSAERIEELYREALEAMKSYGGDRDE